MCIEVTANEITTTVIIQNRIKSGVKSMRVNMI